MYLGEAELFKVAFFSVAYFALTGTAIICHGTMVYESGKVQSHNHTLLDH